MACHTPYYKRPKGYLREIPLPCGNCPICKRNRVNQWVFRLKQEEKRSISAYFVTLTYDREYLPRTRNNYRTLSRHDWQLFMKKLRRRNESKKRIRYYTAGEYGSKRGRPHYHSIMFNVTDVEMINDSWQKGIVYVGNVSGNSIAYTAKYIDKDKDEKRHSRDDRTREFSVMSKNLGDNYLTAQQIKYHKYDLSRNYVLDGKWRIPMPRYYRNIIYTPRERAIQRYMIEIQKRKNDVLKAEQLRVRHKGRMTLDDYKETRKRQIYIQFQNRKNKRVYD